MLLSWQSGSPPAGIWDGLNPWWRTTIVLIGATLIYGFVRLVLLERLARLAASTANDLDDRLVHFVRRFFGLVLVFVTLLVICKIHGIEITPLVAGAGIAGIAVGFAAKETLADILAGVFLIVDRPMRVGDRVKIEQIGRDWGGWGDVVDLGLRRTMIRNTDGVVVNYPNNVLANSVITNFSYEREPIRVRVRLVVDYTADLEQARKVAAAAISRTSGVLQDTAEVVIRGLWDDSRGHLVAGVLMEGRYRIGNVTKRTRIRSAVLENLLSDLRAAGVALAAPRLRLEKDA